MTDSAAEIYTADGASSGIQVSFHFLARGHVNSSR
jgi:hypothetical protein